MNAPSKISASLHQAMVLAFPEIEGATKDSTNPHFKAKYADLSSVIEAIKPALVRHGLFFTQSTHPCEGGVSVETKVHHSSGQEMSFGALFVPANKNDAQGYGSALTYARRYSLMTAFGVAPEDDDGNAAARSAPRATPISDEQRDMIQTLAPGAGKTLQGICEAYKVGSLAELSEAQGVKLIAYLKSQPLQSVKELAPAGDVLDDEIPY